VLGVLADELEQTVAIGQDAEWFARLRAIEGALQVTSPGPFCHAVLAVAGNVHYFAFQGDLLAGTIDGYNRRDCRQQQGGSEQGCASTHDSPPPPIAPIRMTCVSVSPWP